MSLHERILGAVYDYLGELGYACQWDRHDHREFTVSGPPPLKVWLRLAIVDGGLMVVHVDTHISHDEKWTVKRRLALRALVLQLGGLVLDLADPGCFDQVVDVLEGRLRVKVGKDWIND